MAEMALSTEERLKQTYEMRIPQIIELLDMSETTHQKVCLNNVIYWLSPETFSSEQNLVCAASIIMLCCMYHCSV